MTSVGCKTIKKEEAKGQLLSSAPSIEDGRGRFLSCALSSGHKHLDWALEEGEKT